jgi:hypothetical protein
MAEPVMVSVIAVKPKFTSTTESTTGVTVTLVALIAVTVDAENVSALAGTIDSAPKPKAATVTSAMRLKVVFVDICFLSIVDPRDFPESAW